MAILVSERFVSMRSFTPSLRHFWLRPVLVCCLFSVSMPLSRAQDFSGNWGGVYDSSFSFTPTPYGWTGSSGIGSTGTSADWKLGVTGSNTDVGVYLGQVEANSSAMRAGIGLGDTIICVGNNQVGRIGNQVFDLGQAINRDSDSYGRVRILLLSASSRQLRSLQVQLDKQAGGLSGTISIQGSGLALDSVVNVELQNVTRPHFVVRNGSVSFRPSFNLQREIPFVLNYDPRYISQTDSYRLRATVTSRGSVTHTTEQPPFVLTRGYPSSVVLTLSPVFYGGVTLPSGFSNINTVGYQNYNTSIQQQVTAAYEQYLGRSPSVVELAVWTSSNNGQNQYRDVQLEVLGSQEYFDRVGNNNVVWLQRVFSEMLGRNASSDEMNQWMRRFSELGFSRTELLKQLKRVSVR
jgi:uncharacterized lipoprotein YbaY